MNLISTTRSRLLVFSAAMFFGVSACSAQNVASAEKTSDATDTMAGGSLPVVHPVATSQFVLGKSDVIRVNVWKNLELSQTVTVGPDGFVSLPLLGDVQVAGLTADRLGKVLAVKLSSYILNPQVTVSVVEIRSRQVFILGQVSKPGGFPLVTPIRVLQLIAQAGGLTNYANRKGIVVLRPDNGGVARLPFNFNKVVHGDDKQNIELQPGDTVVVP